MLLACACAFSFNACSDDDDDVVDIRDQAIGTYTGTMDFGYMIEADDSAFISLDVLFAALADDISDGQELPNISQSIEKISLIKSGNGLIFDDDITFKNIEAANNGFSFDVADYKFNDKITLTGYKGFSIGESPCDGAYISTSKTIGFYMKGTNDDLEYFVFSSWTEEDIENILSLNENVRSIFENGTLTMRVNMTKD